MKALLDGNLVIQTAAAEFDVHSGYVWMDCTNSCKAGWTLVDGVLTAPAVQPARTYAQLRRQKYNLLNQDEMRYDDLVNSTTTWQDAITAIKAEFPKP